MKFKCSKKTDDFSSSLILREGDEQSYAKVVRMLGNNRCILNVHGVEKLGLICGRLRKRRNMYIGVDDTVLISIRDYQDDKVDIIHLYSPQDVKLLIKYGEIPQPAEECDESNVIFEHI